MSSASSPQSQPQMQLVCLIASVIKCPRRLGYFKFLLDSIRVQIDQLDGLIISVFIDPSLEASADFFNGLGGRKCRVLRQKRAKAQFLQIQEMLSRVATVFPPQGKETFLLFSDDDDIWHPERAKCYRDSFHTVPHDDVSSIAFFFMLEIAKRTECTCLARERGDVQGMIDCGCVKFDFTANQDPPHLEFHEYAVRPYVLNNFFLAYPRLAINRFCDVQFVEFMRHEPLKKWRVGSDHWLYFYRKIAEPGYEAAGYPLGSVDPSDIEALFRAEILYALDWKECPVMMSCIDQMSEIRKGALERGALEKFDSMVIAIEEERARKM